MEIRILVVDDEEIIRDGICNKINRLFPKAEIVGKALETEEALKLVELCKPNVIITDICMPETNGIAFLKQVKLIDERIRFVIISGYQDFSYAREAIKLGAEDYLLKPIEDNQLLDTLIKIDGIFEEENKKNALIVGLESRAKMNTEFLENKYLTDLMINNGDFDMGQCRKNLDILGISFTKAEFSILSFMLAITGEEAESTTNSELQLVKDSIRKTAEDILSHIGKVVSFDLVKDNKQVIVIINHDNKYSYNETLRLKNLCKGIIQSINNTFKVSLSIGISKNCSSIKDFPAAYSEAYISVLQRMILGNNKVINFEDVQSANKITFFLNDEFKMQLVNYIKEGNSKHSSEVIDKLFKSIEKENISYQNMHVLFIDLFLMLSKIVKTVGGSWENIFKEDIFSEGYLLKFTSLTSLKKLIIDKIIVICSYINELAKPQGRKVIDEIKYYIDNYYYTDVNLTTLAGKYYLNSNYLGQLFKIEVGENFVDYLTKKRIEKSTDLLLHTEFHAYRVAEMVGYENSRYFCDVFKKVIGLTPSQYRLKNSVNIN